jgi:peptide chain release factor subunit 1
VLGGCADFKTVVHEDEKFDARLFSKVVKIVDTSYGGENGLNQAIDLSAECMKGQRFAREKVICSKFYEEIAKDTHMVVYGMLNTMKALEGGALESMMVYENADFFRLQLRNKDTDSVSVLYLKHDEIKNNKNYKDGIHG